MENNYILLERYRKKLSIYFALFILFSVWLTYGVFLFWWFYIGNLNLEVNLERKFSWVENIINNYDDYLQRVSNNDTTLEKIIERSLENVVIFKWCEWWVCTNKIVDNIVELESFIIYSDENFINYWSYKYLNNDTTYKWSQYKVIIKTLNDYAFSIFIKKYLNFILFTLPFSVLFFFLGHFFVWKNLRPIKETISWLEDFTANINHEIKTPLAEIISSLSLAKKLKNFDEAIDQSIDSSKKITKILDSMLWIVNLVDSSYKKERLNLVKEVKSIIKKYSKSIEEKNLTIKTNFNKNIHLIKASREHIDICVWNILQNAIKYSYKKWIIEINFNDWKLEIRDYWVGIKKENLKNIFHRYFRENYTKEQWYGIWLALVKKIVDLNAWRINIESSKRDNLDRKKWTKVIISFSK